jgi:uncharacterized protein YjbI with pentapeptide repeats
MNPELLRNLWLEFSIRRLIAMPLVLGLIFAAPLLRDDAQRNMMESRRPAASSVVLFESPFPDRGTSIVGMTAGPMLQGGTESLPDRIAFLVTIGFLLFVWGTRVAADSLLAEVAGRTWDAQRASAVGPWAMTVGKLFGGTAYTWYGALFCLLFWADGGFFRPATVVSIVIAAIWAQALSLFSALLLLRRAPDRSRFRVTLSQAVTLVVAGILIFATTRHSDLLHWYSLEIPTDIFVPSSLALAAGWSVVGVCQLMRGELQVETRPWTWIGFLLTLSIYVGGFASQPYLILSQGWASASLALPARSLVLSGLTMSILALISALMAPPRLLTLRRLVSNGPSLRPRWTYSPAWTWPLVLAGVLIALAALLRGTGAGMSLLGGSLDGPATLAAASFFLFVLRDIGILHVLALNPASRRGVMAAVVVIAVSYLVLPNLASAIHADDLAPLFRPTPLASPALALGAPLIEAAIAWALAARVFDRLGRRHLPALLGLLLLGPLAAASARADEPCPRTSAHEFLLEASLVFEGRVVAHTPAKACTNTDMVCGNESFAFQVDRVLKGDAKPGDKVWAMRMPTNRRRPSLSDPSLAMPDSGLFALVGHARGWLTLPANLQYVIDECLLGAPADFPAAAEAYAIQTDQVRSAAAAAPADVEKLVALADHLLSHRDGSARSVLEQGLLRFPRSQALHAQALYVMEPMGTFVWNPLVWYSLRLNLPNEVRDAFETPAAADPGAPSVRRLAMMNLRRPAERDSPLRDFNDFSFFSFSGLQFPGAAMPGARFIDSRISGSNFRGADLTSADMRWAELDQVDLSFARLTDANLSDWNPATRNGPVLIHRLGTGFAEMVATRMVDIDDDGSVSPFDFFLGSLLGSSVPVSVPVKLLRATLDRAQLDRATLIRADMREASFEHASLKDADLREADLRGADLTAADLSGARLAGAKSDCRTKWPEGFQPKIRPDLDSTTLFCREYRLRDDR